MAEPAATKERMLMIGTPCYNGNVTVNYLRSVIPAIGVLERNGVRTGMLTPSHESLITRARNLVANEFMRQEEFTHLLFIDADIGFSPDLPWKYLEADKDVVCGIYPVKNLDVEKLRTIKGNVLMRVAQAASLHYAVKLKPGGRPEPGTGLLPVEYGATGFMLIRREVFMRLAEAYPELAYDYAYTNDDHVNNVAFFETAIDPATRDYLPEDYAFCKRWTDIGGEIYADVHSVFTHVGTYEYTGNFTAFLTHLGPPDK
ncbi:conserved hypothetical protein [Solidesulfovibrio fructosivorans JJ]]|uniref:Uncharacterized protein n=1 Tax=Solidesulfovibrio fructosivorans JJ] TaxID=596151 RepID=E1K033_SOLFR|nr:hypothetical protein [Solidesulfovibrio fructosivorans]EFL50039.1 conserved hypothetical protein [Solidesulfovibrio fructosivorans JJ]]